MTCCGVLVKGEVMPSVPLQIQMSTVAGNLREYRTGTYRAYSFLLFLGVDFIGVVIVSLFIWKKLSVRGVFVSFSF